MDEIDRRLSRLEIWREGAHERIINLEAHMYGSNCSDEPGIKTRVDRLEQGQVRFSARAALLVTVVASVISAIGGIICAYIMRGGPH